MTDAITLSLAERFALILDGVRKTLAAKLAANRAAGPLLLLLWSRLNRMGRRFTSLAGRPQADRQLPSATQTRPVRRGTPHPPVPRGFAWLVRLVPEVAVYGSQLQYLLTEPEMAALLRAAPQAGRILRPLCHMLAVQLPAILQPKLPEPPAPPAPTPATPTPATPTTATPTTATPTTATYARTVAVTPRPILEPAPARPHCLPDLRPA